MLPLGIAPDCPISPLRSAFKRPRRIATLESLVSQVEIAPGKESADGRGWTVLAPVLAKLGRFDEAARAYRNMMA